MPNSAHSEKILRQFDATLETVGEPLKERLWDVWQEGEEAPCLGQQLSLDVTFLATALHHRQDGLSDEQCALLGDLYDHALGPDNDALTLAQHRARFSQLVANSIFWEPPTGLLNLLRGYDAFYKTAFAEAYLELLVEMASAAIALGHCGTGADKPILPDFQSTWTEVIQAARLPERRLSSDSGELIALINSAVQDFLAPTRAVIDSIEELAKLNVLRNIEGFIRRSLTNYLAQAVLVDEVVHPKELELLHDLAPTLGIYGDLGSVENLKAKFEQVSQKVPATEVPLLITILDIHDEDNEGRTNLGERSRALFLKLTGTVFGVDLDVDPEELQWFNQFKETLYPQEAAQVAE